MCVCVFGEKTGRGKLGDSEEGVEGGKIMTLDFTVDMRFYRPGTLVWAYFSVLECLHVCVYVCLYVCAM